MTLLPNLLGMVGLQLSQRGCLNFYLFFYHIAPMPALYSNTSGEVYESTVADIDYSTYNPALK
jgi:hypothetical protein